MPPPPTPLSGCPLKRLEIHDRLSSRVHDASQSDASLTLSLEGQRSPSGDANDLVLRAHLGLQRLLSFQLTDLLNSTNGRIEAVTIDKDSQQLSVNSQQHGQRLLVTFGEMRDFNVAACMLTKFGFQVKDGIPKPNQPLSNELPSTVATLGPRLSSITPLSWPGSHDQPQGGPDLSFASMLNSNIPLPQSSSPYARLQSVPSIAQVQSPILLPSSPHQLHLSPLSHHMMSQTMSQPVYHSPFNPYHVFLGRQFHHPHQPFIGSPLRNSLNVEGSQDPMMMTGIEHLAHPHQPLLGMLQDGRSISVPVIPHPFQGSQDSQASSASQSSPGFQLSQDSQGGSQSWTTDLTTQSASQSSGCEGFSQTSTGTFDQSREKRVEDIQGLMPRPRELPFAQQSTKTGESGPAVKSKPKSKPKAKKVPAPAPAPTPAPKAKPKPKPKPKSEPKSKVATKEKPPGNSAAKSSSTGAKKKPEKRAQSRPQANSESGSQGEQKASSKKVEPKKSTKEVAKAKPAAKPRPKPKPKPAQKAEVKAKAAPQTTLSKQVPKASEKGQPEQLLDSREQVITQQEESKPTAKRTRTHPPSRQEHDEPSADSRKRCKRDPPLSQDPFAPSLTPSRTAIPPGPAVVLPTMLLTDHDALEKINQVTAKLLEQYEADLARGCRAGTYASFYAERIHSVRRDFWAAELTEARDRSQLVLSEARCTFPSIS